jgi:hypothetical protein
VAVLSGQTICEVYLPTRITRGQIDPEHRDEDTVAVKLLQDLRIDRWKVID